MTFARSNSFIFIKYHIMTDVSLSHTPVIDNVSLFVLQQAYKNSLNQTESQFVFYASEQDLSSTPKTSKMCDGGLDLVYK